MTSSKPFRCLNARLFACKCNCIDNFLTRDRECCCFQQVWDSITLHVTHCGSQFHEHQKIDIYILNSRRSYGRRWLNVMFYPVLPHIDRKKKSFVNWKRNCYFDVSTRTCCIILIDQFYFRIWKWSEINTMAAGRFFIRE